MDPARYEIRFLPEAEEEREALKARERKAMDNAIDKLRQVGPELGAPHSSQVKGAEKLRELRPRQGRSVVRPLYRRIDRGTFVIAAVAPEVETDRRGYERAVKQAEKRLELLEQDEADGDPQ